MVILCGMSKTKTNGITTNPTKVKIAYVMKITHDGIYKATAYGLGQFPTAYGQTQEAAIFNLEASIKHALIQTPITIKGEAGIMEVVWP